MKTQGSLFFSITVLLAGLYCLALLFLEINGIAAILAVMGVCVALPLTFRHSNILLGIVIACIGLCPFFVRARVLPGLPMLYADDAVIIYALLYAMFSYSSFGSKTFDLGKKNVVILFILFMALAAIPFALETTAKTASRNFTETFVLGFVMYLFFYNETNNKNIDTIFRWITAVTLVLSCMTIAETIIQDNPLLRFAEKIIEDFMYMPPENFKLLNSYYRPYTVFFHPSEAGTFMAMGLPLSFYAVRNCKPLLKYPLCLLAVLGVVLNNTRGVWAALILSFIFCNFKMLKKYLPPVIVFLSLLLGFAYMTMSDSPFFTRLFDPTNMYNRLYYWTVGLNMFMATFPFGIGHMNFKHRYLEFVDTAPIPQGLDVKQIFVADNLLLTTLVEQGLLGCLVLLMLFGVGIACTAKAVRYFRQINDPLNALRSHALLQALVVYLIAGAFADVQLFSKATKFFFIVMGMAFSLTKNHAMDEIRIHPAAITKPPTSTTHIAGSRSHPDGSGHAPGA